MTLDQLYERAAAQGIEIDEIHMRELSAISFPEGWIAIDPRKFCTRAEFKCALAHEIAHIETGSFYNVWSPYDLMEKCEHKANRHMIHMLVPLDELLAAIHSGCCTRWALAGYFDVTEEVAQLAIDMYMEWRVAQ